jgi:trk system potassium uptake protein TrkA
VRILILGAGQVGTALVEYLSKDEDNDITIVDIDEEKLTSIDKHLDVRTVCGYAVYPSILEEAGIEDMDMVIAVTFSDEHNMIICQMAHTLYHVKKKFARIRAVEYLQKKSLFTDSAIPIDYTISPEIIITEYIDRIIDNPGALQVLNFENGLVQLVTVRAYAGTNIVGHPIKEIQQYLPHTQMRIVSLFRDGEAIPAYGDTVIQEGDDVYFVTKKVDTKEAISAFRRRDRRYQNIMIAGGGNIGFKLAEALEEDHKVRVVELDKQRVRELTAKLSSGTLVLQGNVTDEFLLKEDGGIEKTDLFLALTQSDETNIMASILAKKLGAKRTIALLKRNIYVDLARKSGDIDIVISPDQITAGRILAQIRKGDTMAVYSLRQGGSEAIELIVHGNKNTSKVVGKSIGEIDFPDGVKVGCIVREKEVIMGSRHLMLKEGDHIIMVLTNIDKVHEVENLFQEIS